MVKIDIALVRPEMLIWARESAGMTLEVAARRLKLGVEKLRNWEQGNSSPTIRQAHLLSDIYQQPFAAFYLPKPPNKKYPKVPDYRMQLKRGDQNLLSSDLTLEIHKAFERREIALELYENRTETPPVFSLRTNVNANPENLGKFVREKLGIQISSQKSWKRPELAFSKWRSLIESLGVLVFQTNNSRIAVREVRGFSISEKVLPVIVINRKDAPSAKIFTMLHELTHIMLRSSGLCDPVSLYQSAKIEGERVEIFCNKVAAEILIPKKDFLSEEIVYKIKANGIWDDEYIVKLAKIYNSSYEAVLRRLLSFSIISTSFYAQKIKGHKEKFTFLKPSRKGGPVNPIIKSIGTNGKSFTRLVADAYYFNQITSHDCANYLGLKARRLREVSDKLGGRQS